MKAKYESLFKSLKVLKVSLQGLCRSAIAFTLASLVVLSSFTPEANAALFAKKGEVLSTKEIQTLVNAGLTGNYLTDTTDTIKMLREAINLPEDAENRAAVKTSARYKINAYVSRYRADREKSGLYSYTTMLTALNTLAGYYNGSVKRAVPAKVRDRLLQEFDRAETALTQGR
ncbi:photosystem II protein Psb27 [Phormidium tenue]|jgi:photosystem II Psb27 protein|uniref:Photosystem II lipoprotein Psb27 n=1 Tax=Phormidium tenue FACHB-1050 TaxID=2692857 RepID=A0ABR8CH27_9CYAN|nr:photosystem II protein Psb27 [Phormidium tenue]MBD2319350.1 photosystem II protein Psb27 [Phormidium tenue FACHB-1050]